MATKKGTNKNDHLAGTNRDDILYGLSGNDILDGGKGNDDIVAGDGNDKIIGRFDGVDVVDGGKGTDTLDYSQVNSAGIYFSGTAKVGNVSKDSGVIDSYLNIEVIVGTKSNDNTDLFGNGISFYGSGGDDVLRSHGGVMRGDAGADTLTGDTTTEDVFWLQRGKGADTIYNFTASQDTIRLSGDDFELGPLVGIAEFIFHTSSHEAEGTRAQLIMQTNSGELYYDPDGTGVKGAELIAVLVNANAPYWSDFEIV